MYSDVVDVRQNIKRSINLEFDLHDSVRIEEYIPLNDACRVLRQFLKVVLGQESDFSTLFIGPYGKGKSYLMLVLLELLSGRITPAVSALIEKTKAVDSELYGLIQEIQSKQIKLLPVIINSNYDDLERAFLVALDTALQREEVQGVYLNTVFSQCLEMFESWKERPDYFEQYVFPCMEKEGINEKELIKSLQAKKNNGLEVFRNLYNCVTFGFDFNPLINDDILKTYDEIVVALNNQSYTGIFIVFDEFSKSIEVQDEKLSKKIKLIQDFAEKANRSNQDRQIHLCCITHKSLDLYSEANKGRLKQTFKAVEGRFKEIHLNQRIQDNFQLIGMSLLKKPQYKSMCEAYYQKHASFYQQLLSYDGLTEEQKKYLTSETFPYNPITVSALIKLSELVAQNERTLFTSISDSDSNSFLSFIQGNCDGLYNLDALYNYFQNQIEKSDERTASIWYQAEQVLSVQREEKVQKFVKVLALILMINDYSSLEPDINTISLALQMDISEAEQIKNQLVQDQVVKELLTTGYLVFTNQSTKEIELLLEKYSLNAQNKYPDSFVMDFVQEEPYYIPKRYNLEFRIKRYFSSKTIDEKTFQQLHDLSGLKEDQADGLVLNVLLDSDSGLEGNLQHFRKVENPFHTILRIIEPLDETIKSRMSRVSGLFNLLECNEITKEQKEVIFRILDVERKDLKDSINSAFAAAETYTVSRESKAVVKQGNPLTSVISQLCKESFPKTPIVNLEMINKHEVSTGYNKPYQSIVNALIHKTIEEYLRRVSSTSAERTIYNTFFTAEGQLDETIRPVIEQLKSIFYQKALISAPIRMKEITSFLKEEPYGIREGVIPGLIAIALNEIEDYPVFYYQKKQIDIDFKSLLKAISSPENYSLLFSKKSAENDQYLKSLLGLFRLSSEGSFYHDLETIKDYLKAEINRMPLILRDLKLNDNYLGVPTEFIKMKSLISKYDINVYEVFFKDIPGLFNGDRDKIVSFIENIQANTNWILVYKKRLIDNIVEIFDGSKGESIKSSFNNWFMNVSDNSSGQILEGKSQNIKIALLECSYDDELTINQLAKIITGYSIEDWTHNHQQLVLKSVQKFKTDFETKTKDSMGNLLEPKRPKDFTTFGKLLRNSLESSLNEFGQAVSNEEKKLILESLYRQIFGEENDLFR